MWFGFRLGLKFGFGWRLSERGEVIREVEVKVEMGEEKIAVEEEREGRGETTGRRRQRRKKTR